MTSIAPIIGISDWGSEMLSITYHCSQQTKRRMRVVVNAHRLPSLCHYAGLRMFSQAKVGLNHASSASSSAERVYGGRSTRRFIQTNQMPHNLDTVGPERWNFQFPTKERPSVSHRTTRKLQNPSTLDKPSVDNFGAAAKQPAKWSTYSLPSKETILKQKEQMEEEEKEANKKLAAQPQKKKAKRKLRPRKALISLTPSALSHLKALLNQPEPKLIRIGVKNRGCSGLTYDLEYITEPGKFDEVVEQDGVKVIIDSKALFSIVGSEMDWIDDKLSSRFVFKNPNSKGTCGCGESFMV